MTTTSESPPSRWTRFIPRQFGLRALPVFITLAALALGVLSRLYVPRTIAAENLDVVTKGMTPLQVRWQLGAPRYTTVKGRHELWWGYDAGGTINSTCDSGEGK